MIATFTRLRDLKRILDRMTDEELDAATSEVDWFQLDTFKSAKTGIQYFRIEGKDGGEP